MIKEFSQFKKSRLVWNAVSGVVNAKTVDFLNSHPELDYVYNFTFLEKKEDISHHRDFIKDDNDIFKTMNQKFLAIKEKFNNDLSNKVIFDPGLGFSKNAAQDFSLLKGFLTSHLSLPDDDYLIGMSRKSFLKQFIPDGDDCLLLKESIQFKTLCDFFAKPWTGKIFWRIHDRNLYQSAHNYFSKLSSVR